MKGMMTMKKLLKKILAVAISTSMLHIPAIFVHADHTLWNLNEDLSSYTSLSDLQPGWSITDEETAVAEIGSNGGYQIRQVSPIFLKASGAQNPTMSPYLQRLFSGSIKDEENGTTTKINKFQGIYEISMDFSLDIQHREVYEGVELGYPFFTVLFGNGTEAQPVDFGTSAIILRINTNGVTVMNSSAVSQNTMTNKSQYFANTDIHNVTLTLNTIDKTASVIVDGNGTKISTGSFFYPLEFINGFSVLAMQRMDVDSFFNIKRVAWKELESANRLETAQVVENLPEKLSDNPAEVTENITLPVIPGVTWTSSNTSAITDAGVIRQLKADTPVTMTAHVDLNNNGGIYEKHYEMTLKKTESSSSSDSFDKLYYFEEDFTQFNSFEKAPRWSVSKSSPLTELRASPETGVEMFQIDTRPVVEGKPNSALAPYIHHVIEGTLQEDTVNRTQYKLHRFNGKFKMKILFEYNCEPVGTVDGVSVTAPFYIMSINQASNVDDPASASVSVLSFRLRPAYAQVYIGTTSAGNVYFDASRTVHEIDMEVDTTTQEAKVIVDGNTGKIITGKMTLANYLNALTIQGMERMKVGSYLRIKSIEMEQVEASTELTEAAEAINSLPQSLTDDPYSVTENITLPIVENVKWTTSDADVIEEDGTIHRWYDDRDVVLTATYLGQIPLIKTYTLTVRSMDNLTPKTLADEHIASKQDITHWTFGNSTSGRNSVTNDGLCLTKTTDYSVVNPAFETKAYFAQNRLYGEEEPYDSGKRAAVYSTGYTGVYDVGIDVTPHITGNAPANIYVGRSENGDFLRMVGFVFRDNGIVLKSNAEDSTAISIFEGSTVDKTFSLRLRIDTTQGKAWGFIDGKLASNAIPFSAGEDTSNWFDTLEVALDQNNKQNDNITINNVKLTQWDKNSIIQKEALLGIADKLSVTDITYTPNATDTILDLPAMVDGVPVIWTSNNPIVNLTDKTVYHNMQAEDVTISALLQDENGLYVRKDFCVTVRAASDLDEFLEYYVKALQKEITQQNYSDIRYNLQLPTDFMGQRITWTSSRPEIISTTGVLNRSIAITERTPVILTAKIQIGDSQVEKQFEFTVSPYAYKRVVYTGTSLPQKLTVGSCGNVNISHDTWTHLEFKQSDCADGKIILRDADNNVAMTLCVSDGYYYFDYGDGSSAKYPIGNAETAQADILLMPDLQRIAVWTDGKRAVDFGKTSQDVSGLAKITLEGENLSVTAAEVSTDEYGMLQINADYVDYFAAFKKGVLKDNITLESTTVTPAIVQWISNNPDLITNSGTITKPSTYQFVQMTVKLTSTTDSTVYKTMTRPVAIACDATLNLMQGASVRCSTNVKASNPLIYINDGDLNTCFGATNAHKQPVLTIDLGEQKYINCLYLSENHDNYDVGIVRYEIAYSEDGNKWTTLKTGNISDLQSNLIAFNTVHTRYLSFTVLESLNEEIYINELEAYLFTTPAELVALDVSSTQLDLGYSVTSDISLPAKGQFGTALTWSSSHPSIISATGVVTKPQYATTVTLTVSAECDGQKFSKSFSAYVPGVSAGGTPISGGGTATGGAGGGLSVSAVPGFVSTTETKDTPIQQPESDTIFTDVPKNHWAYDAIKTLYEQKIIDGDGANRYNPSDAVTREQFVKMLVLTLNLDIDASDLDFSDVSADQWYAPYISTAVQQQIVKGVSSETFGVGVEIQRQDMAVMLQRILLQESTMSDNEYTPFADDDAIADYARDAVYAVRAAKIIEGYENKFNPTASLSRAEAAVVLVKLWEHCNMKG